MYIAPLNYQINCKHSGDSDYVSSEPQGYLRRVESCHEPSYHTRHPLKNYLSFRKVGEGRIFFLHFPVTMINPLCLTSPFFLIWPLFLLILFHYKLRFPFPSHLRALQLLLSIRHGMKKKLDFLLHTLSVFIVCLCERKRPSMVWRCSYR